MSKRLQVLVSEEEFATFRVVARRGHLSVGEWVRGALRRAAAEADVGSADEKIKAIREALQYAGPTGDIDVMNAQIAEGSAAGLH